MNLQADPENKRVVEFIDTCRRLGMKVTHQRIQIFLEVIQTDEHPDAEDIYLRVRKRIPTVSRNTVYSTLQLLVEQGLISTMGVHHDRRRYDGNMRPHHHIVCTQCGKVSDFASEDYLEISLPLEFKSWGRIASSHVELRGTCSECLEKLQGGEHIEGHAQSSPEHHQNQKGDPI